MGGDICYFVVRQNTTIYGMLYTFQTGKLGSSTINVTYLGMHYYYTNYYANFLECSSEMLSSPKNLVNMSGGKIKLSHGRSPLGSYTEDD